jgi:GNAT superfamily N-acetyltransferase
MKIRLATSADEEPLRNLWNASCVNDRLTVPLFREKTWDDPDFRGEQSLVAEHDARIIGFAMGVHRQATGRGHVKMLAVDSACRRMGMGTELLHELESRLRASGCTELRVDEAAPNYLSPGLDQNDLVAVAFFKSQGYQTFAESCNLKVRLAGTDWSTEDEETALRSASIECRRAAAHDRLAVREFLGRHWAAWQDEVARTFLNDPVSLHIALLDGQIVGFAAYDANNRGFGWFGPMGTTPTCRGRGVGRVLLRRCLDDQRIQGHSISIIPWVGPVEFYEHHAGAETMRRFYRMNKVL